MLNSILLGAQDPRGDEPPWAVVSDLAFNVLFTLEVAVKVVALGAWGGEAAYFRDAWNRFDFVTVCAGWLPYALCVGLARNPSHCFTGKGASGATLNITFLRVVKVVKVLKTVQRIPGMRCLFVSLFKAAPLLTQVIEVLLFIFFVFGAIGVQLFMGRLRQRCVDAETHAPAGDHVCSEAPAWGGHRCGRGERCTDRDARGKAFDNPDGLNKYVSFDNILLGFATVLSTMSLEGWSGTLF
ncbi:Ion transport domain-containing protein, partial [Pelagophyceae sp. CCMP2097]